MIRYYYPKVTRGDVKEAVVDIGRQMYHSPNSFVGKLYKELDGDHNWAREGSVHWEDGDMEYEFRVKLKLKRKN